MPAEKRQPRPFQHEVLKLIARGKNIILQAPTGAGKTDAALLPFIQNLEHGGNNLPYTCLYATPMRVLSTQFYEKYRTRITDIDKVRGTTLARPYEYFKRNPISIQTGEQPDDPQFESILTFCTIDQLLASFLGIPYGVDGRRANINVGAIVSSFLVLDEFHLYPLVRNDTSCFGARTTTLSMLRLLQSTTRFILMTATFSTTLLNKLKELLDAEIVPITFEDLNIISNGRERTFEIASSSMDVETILDSHDRCSLVICNTVQRAQEKYWQMKDRAEKRGIEVVLLHSRLTSADRTFRSGHIMHELGQASKKWDGDIRYGWKNGAYYGKNIIVVATQVVEVGLDISVQTLHTELAPANSLIQRAGRCARFAQQKGKVIVYPPRDAEGREISSRPYDKPICDKTWEALHDVDKHIVGFKEEQVLIDAVHTEEDRSLLERYDSNHGHITKSIFTSLNEYKRGIATSLIRDIAQVHILIHNHPNEAIKEDPWKWQSFTLHPDSLAGHWQALQKRAVELDLPWVCKQAVAIQVNDTPENDPEADNKLKTQYKWVDIPSSGTFDTIAASLRDALMVVLPSQLAIYHDELGFMLLDDSIKVDTNSYQSAILSEKKGSKPTYEALKHQSYQEHISGLVEAYDRSIRPSIQYVIRRLEKLTGLSIDTIDQAIRLAIACHDLGKLGQQWQQWAWDWQILLFKEQGWPSLPDQPYFFAKTDFDHNSPGHRKLRAMMKLKRPPHHACESVALGMELIAASLVVEDDDKREMLLRAVCGAIAHHHTPDAHEYGPIRLKQSAAVVVKEALERAKEQASWIYDLSLLETSELEGDDLSPTNTPALITRSKQGRLHEPETWLYFVIVRALRLADQRAGKFV